MDDQIKRLIESQAWHDGFIDGLIAAYKLCDEHKNHVCNSVREALKQSIIILGGDVDEKK